MLLEAIIKWDGMTLEDAEEQGIISNLSYSPATSLKLGMEYVNGQYTYEYIGNGWHVTLTDKESTESVTTTLCTKVNNYPITDMVSMFAGSQATSIDLSSFDTSNVTYMNSMFAESQAVNLDFSSFDTSNVTDMSGMFIGSQATSLDLSRFDTSNVTDMSNMFDGSKATSIDLSRFDTSNVTNMFRMFHDSQATSLDLSSFDTSNVTDMGDMFHSSRAVTIYVSNLWNINGLNETNYMFNCSAVVGQNGTRAYESYGIGTCTGDTGNPKDETYARVDNPPDSPGYFTYKAAPNN